MPLILQKEHANFAFRDMQWALLNGTKWYFSLRTNDEQFALVDSMECRDSFCVYAFENDFG